MNQRATGDRQIVRNSLTINGSILAVSPLAIDTARRLFAHCRNHDRV